MLSWLFVYDKTSFPDPSLSTPSQTHPGTNLDCTLFLNDSLNPSKSVKYLSIDSLSLPCGSWTAAELSRIEKKNNPLNKPPKLILSLGS